MPEYFSFIAAGGDVEYLGDQRWSLDDFTAYLNDTYSDASMWEAACIVVVADTKEGRDALRLHMPKPIAFATKETMRDTLQDILGFENGAVPLIEQPRNSRADMYTFSRDSEARWVPKDVPPFRAVVGSQDQDTRPQRVAHRYLYARYFGEDYELFYPEFGDYDAQHFLLKDPEWGGRADE